MIKRNRLSFKGWLISYQVLLPLLALFGSGRLQIYFSLGLCRGIQDMRLFRAKETKKNV